MGTVIPAPPFIPELAQGGQCPICWGVGKPFGPGNTQNQIIIEGVQTAFILATYGALFSGDPPRAIVPQAGDDACVFRLENLGFTISISFSSSITAFFIRRDGPGTDDFNNTTGVCANIFSGRTSQTLTFLVFRIV